MDNGRTSGINSILAEWGSAVLLVKRFASPFLETERVMTNLIIYFSSAPPFRDPQFLIAFIPETGYHPTFKLRTTSAAALNVPVQKSLNCVLHWLV
jgi:hypothetical protein